MHWDVFSGRVLTVFLSWNRDVEEMTHTLQASFVHHDEAFHRIYALKHTLHLGKNTLS